MPLFAGQLLPQPLIGLLCVGGEPVEAGLDVVPGLGERLLEEAVLAVVPLAQGDQLRTDPAECRLGRRAENGSARSRLLDVTHAPGPESCPPEWRCPRGRWGRERTRPASGRLRAVRSARTGPARSPGAFRDPAGRRQWRAARHRS